MPLDTPRIAATYGALDSNAVQDGRCMHSHIATQAARSANRLSAKSEQAFCVTYPIQRSGEAHDGLYGIAPLFWSKMHSTIRLPKKPGTRTMTIKLRMRISGSDAVQIQCVTRARPFSENAHSSKDNVISITADGDDDVDVYTGTSIPCSDGNYDTLELFIRGEPTGDLYAGTGDDQRSDLSGRPIYGSGSINASGLTTVAWVQDRVAEDGTYIVFNDAQGSQVHTATIIANDTEYLEFAPQAAGPILSDGDDWALYRLPTYEIVAISVSFDARTD